MDVLNVAEQALTEAGFEVKAIGRSSPATISFAAPSDPLTHMISVDAGEFVVLTDMRELDGVLGVTPVVLGPEGGMILVEGEEPRHVAHLVSNPTPKTVAGGVVWFARLIVKCTSSASPPISLPTWSGP